MVRRKNKWKNNTAAGAHFPANLALSCRQPAPRLAWAISGGSHTWRFPYLAAKYGGGIFLLIYILLAVTFGYTMIMAETALGRMTRKSPVGAFAASGKGRWRAFGGWINAVIPILIVPYYSVIGGWVIKYLVGYITGHGSELAQDGYFSSFIANGASVEIVFLLFTLLTLGIILPVSAMVWSVFPG